MYALFHLIAYRGLRQGEAAGLEWEDVDLDGSALTVRRQRTQLGWEVVEHGPKAEAGKRTVALDVGTVAALRAHRCVQVAERLAWGSAWVDSGKVFTLENGEPPHPATLTSDTYTSVYPTVAATAAEATAALVPRVAGLTFHVVPTARCGFGARER